MSPGPDAGPAGPLVLVGLMGSGKSTVGTTLANRLGWLFIDTDAEIERSTGTTVAELFEARGETEFRRLEADAVVQIIETGPHRTVIALGGGAVTSPETRAALADVTVIWLRAEPEALLARLGAEEIAKRPLLASDPLGTMRRLDRERHPYHREVATHIIDVDDRTPAQVTAAVLEAMKT